VTGKCIKPTY